jgi:hypothetical protein
MKISAYGNIYTINEEIKLSYYSYNIKANITHFAKPNEPFILNEQNKFKFICIPDGIDDYTLLIKTEESERTPSNPFEMEFIVGDENTIKTFSTESFSGEKVSIYHTIEQTGTSNIHRNNKSLKYIIIKVSNIIITSDIKCVITPYDGKVNNYILPQKQYFADSMMIDKDVYKVYKLQKASPNDKVIEIEFTFILNSDNYVYAIEDYREGQEPLFITNKNKILKKENKNGKIRIVYDVSNINTILLSF